MTDTTVFIAPAAVTVIGAYLCGSVPFGLLIGKAKGIDVRKAGSGNIGATNVTRVVGKGWGKFCFALDFFKGCLPVLLADCAVRCFGVPDEIGLLPALAAFFAVCGHIWPVWIGFKGGKGVSTAGGAILALSPVPVLIGLAAWVCVFFASRYVSLASITAAVVVPTAAFLCKAFHVGPRELSIPDLVLFCILCIMTIVKHTSNIKRLCNGTENRFEKKKPEEKR